MAAFWKRLECFLDEHALGLIRPVVYHVSEHDCLHIAWELILEEVQWTEAHAIPHALSLTLNILIIDARALREIAADCLEMSVLLTNRHRHEASSAPDVGEGAN